MIAIEVFILIPSERFLLTTADAEAVLMGWTIHSFLLDRIRRFCQPISKSGQGRSGCFSG